MHVHNLGVELHEDYLMKMFMVDLEGNSWSWYDRFPSDSLYSIKYFRTVFHEHFKDQYPSLLLGENYYMHVKGFIHDLENMYGDDQFMDEELLDILKYNSFHKKGGSIQVS